MRLSPLLLSFFVIGAGCGTDDAAPTADPTDWCARVAAGPGASEPAAVGLARAHFVYRYFGLAAADAVADYAAGLDRELLDALDAVTAAPTP